MAPQGSKRVSVGSELAPPEKRTKVDSTLEGVFEAVQRADLSESCKRMLTAMIPHTLGIFSEERHELQTMGVQALEEVMDTIKAEMQAAIDAEASNVAEAENEKARLQGKVDEVDARITSIKEDMEGKKGVLREHSMVLLQKRPVLAKAQQDVTKGNVELEAATAEKEGLEAAKTNHLQPLVSTTLEGDFQVHYEGLLPFLPSLNMEESLRNAVPGTVCKPASERGAFDAMVIEQLQNSFNDRVAALEKIIDAETPAAAERNKILASAQEEHDAVKSKCREAASALTDVQLLLQEVEAAKVEAEVAVAEYEPHYAKLTKVRDEKVEVLKAFEDYNYECFKTCRDRTAPAPKPDKVAEKVADLDAMQVTEEAAVAEAGA